MNRIRKIAAALLAAIFMAALVPQTQVSAASARKTNEIKVYNYLVGTMGFNTAAACGLMANVELESNFSVKEVGDGNTSFGLFQWHRGRKQNLIKYCADKGLDYQTVEGQLSYLEYELKKSYKGVYNHIKAVENSADGAYDAGYYWCYYYEVPSNRAYKANQRGNLAKNSYWKKYKGYKGKQIELSENASAGTTQSSTTTSSETTTAAAANDTQRFTRTLKVQSPLMKGADVKYIQNCLKKLGYSISADGKYGSGSASAVKSFQKKQGLKSQNGQCDKATWNAIVKAAAKAVPLKITQQPKPLSIQTGEKATFSVKATGNGLKYQWYYKKVGAKSWTLWKGQTKATITATAKDCWAGRSVRCTVKDSSGKTVNSSAAKINITAKKTTAASTTTTANTTTAASNVSSKEVAVG